MIRWVEKHFFKIIFLLWIVVLLELVGSYKYLAFLRQEFGILVLVGVLMMILFLVTDIGIKKLTLEMKLRGAILVLPLLYLLFAQGTSLDSYAFQKRNIESLNSVQAEGLESYEAGELSFSLQLPPAEGNVIPTTLLNLFQSPMLYQKKNITVIGMVYRDPSLPENQFILFRFSVTCCAADAMPLAVQVDTQNSFTIENDTWLQVTGEFDLDEEDSMVIPVIQNAKVEQIPAPQNPYL